jgi:hypothetical protein
MGILASCLKKKSKTLVLDLKKARLHLLSQSPGPDGRLCAELQNGSK